MIVIRIVTRKYLMNHNAHHSTPNIFFFFHSFFFYIMDSKHNSTDSDKWIQWIEDGISKCYINYYEYKVFQNIKRIGCGGFSNVYRANWENSNTVVALKSFKNDSCIKEIVNEVRKFIIIFHKNGLT